MGYLIDQNDVKNNGKRRTYNDVKSLNKARFSKRVSVSKIKSPSTLKPRPTEGKPFSHKPI